MSRAEDVRAAWLDEPITYRQFLTEQALLLEEVSWLQASEATATVLLAHPEIDGDRLKPRGEWKV
jgi:hypothetical protein